MSKICPECGKPPIEEGLIRCHKCKVPFVEESEMGLKLSKTELELISKNLVNSWRFWIKFSVAFLVALLLIGVPTVTVIGVHLATKRLNASLDSFNQQASNHLSAAYQDVTNRVSIALQNYEERVDTNLAAAHEDVTNRIAKEFEEPRIQEIVAEVAATQATNLMSQQINPEIENFRFGTSNTLAQFDASLEAFQKQSTNALTDVQIATEFSLTVAKAQNDDRAAFWQLLAIAQMSNSRFASIAENAYFTIANQVEANTRTKETTIAFRWDVKNIDPDKASLQQLVDLYSSERDYPINRFLIIRQIANTDRFSKYERYSFLIKVLKEDNSLTVLEEACLLLDSESKVGKTFTGLSLYLDWWEKNKTNYINTNTITITQESVK